MPLGNLKLRDMKMSASEVKESNEVASDSPRYPWGLQLSLDDDSLDKLGIGLPDIGESMLVVAIARVESVSEHKNGSETTRSVSMQIEKLSLDSKPSE